MSRRAPRFILSSILAVGAASAPPGAEAQPAPLLRADQVIE